MTKKSVIFLFLAFFAQIGTFAQSSKNDEEILRILADNIEANPNYTSYDKKTKVTQEKLDIQTAITDLKLSSHIPTGKLERRSEHRLIGRCKTFRCQYA